MKTVLRNTKGLPIALLFAGLPILLMIDVCLAFANEGIIVNNRRTDNPVALLLPFCIFFVFSALGFAASAAIYFPRIEFDGLGLAIYDGKSTVKYKATWAEIMSMERKKTAWRIVSQGNWITVPSLADPAPFFQNLIVNLPRSIFSPSQIPEHKESGEPASGQIASQTDFAAIAFSIVWYGGGLLLAIRVVIGPFMHPAIDITNSITALYALGCLAAAPFNLVKVAWIRYLKGEFKADELGIEYNDGVKKAKFQWSEVDFIDFIPQRLNAGYLLILAGDQSIKIEADNPFYSRIRDLAVAKAPPDAHVYVNKA